LLDAMHVERFRRKNAETRHHLVGELQQLGYRTLPSEANFIMIDMREDVKPLIAKFREQGVRVGRLFPPMPQHLRVTIGTIDEMKRFLEAFQDRNRNSTRTGQWSDGPRRITSDPMSSHRGSQKT
jgi:histidinol-phosphate/aromatic aminotransferase/cobyric acid decarboxylase-like protein